MLNSIRQYLMVATGYAQDTERISKERLLSEIISQNSPTIDRVCFYYSSSREDFDDLRQDIIINIWNGLDRFRQECRHSTWVYRICLNTCVSTWRKNKRHKDTLPLDTVLEKASAEDNGNIETLHYLISTLLPEDKALLMMWLDDMSYDEISELTGLNRNTVASRLKRIKDKMAKKVKNEAI